MTARSANNGEERGQLVNGYSVLLTVPNMRRQRHEPMHSLPAKIAAKNACGAPNLLEYRPSYSSCPGVPWEKAKAVAARAAA
jgi:hypothetical protein